MTLLALSDAATSLIQAKGPDATIKEIAAAAGVSLRTVFRYVDGKEELAYIHPILWLEVFDAGINPTAEPALPERLHAGGAAIAAHIDAEPDRPRAALWAAASHPELARGFTSIFQKWVDRIAAEALQSIEATGTHSTSDAHFRSRVIGAATMGMVDACTREWLFGGEGTLYTPIFERGFTVLAPILTGT
ncbi:MAG: AcrR family transcriptional regulator [Candidatus Poriferisodalaceae bacterium]|jgi:AcrR family transcriptional regulator